MTVHLIAAGLLLLGVGYICWDSRRTWLDESKRFDASMVEHDRLTAQEIDAAEDWQRRVQEPRY
jgi:hypothetical protein